VQFYLIKVIYWENLEKYDGALEFFNEVLKIDPYDTETWYEKGLTLKKLERYNEALESLNKALEIDPEYELALKAKEKILKAKSNYKSFPH